MQCPSQSPRMRYHPIKIYKCRSLQRLLRLSSHRRHQVLYGSGRIQRNLVRHKEKQLQRRGTGPAGGVILDGVKHIRIHDPQLAVEYGRGDRAMKKDRSRPLDRIRSQTKCPGNSDSLVPGNHGRQIVANACQAGPADIRLVTNSQFLRLNRYRPAVGQSIQPPGGP